MKASSAVGTAAALREQASLFLQSLRPHEWIKNLFVFAPLVFSKHVTDLTDTFLTLLGFGIFCMVSGTVYVLNDLMDLEADRAHPLKGGRPLASGRLSPFVAGTGGIALGTVGVWAAFTLGLSFGAVTLGYLALNVMYSWRLKSVVILDVMLIALGFVLRVYAGGVLIGVPISSWLLLCTFSLAMFIALNKRRHELLLLKEIAQNHRPVLDHYSLPLLSQAVTIMAAIALVSYSLYTTAPETVMRFGTNNLIFTLPFAVFGVLRYLYLVEKRDGGGNPSDILVRDLPTVIALLGWILACLAIIYGLV
jgi:4-hydroxybenzoate polyprenyltransferase